MPKLDLEGRIVSMSVVGFLAVASASASPRRLNNRATKPLPEGAMGLVVGYFVTDDARMAALRRPLKSTARSADK